MPDKPSSLTLADLEAVEKAHERGSLLGVRREFRDHYRQLAANHAVEMSMALAEALSIYEAARNVGHGGEHSCPICDAMRAFRTRWPGLFPEKSEGGGDHA